MTVGKYYCDYCDKEFQDTPPARKRHLQSKPHIRAKALWFDSLKDPNRDFTDGLSKGVCNRFVRTGFCPFGDSCRYLHPKNIPQSTSIPGFATNMQTQMLHGDTVRDCMGTTWGNLPPSLKPPPENGYPPLPFVDWG